MEVPRNRQPTDRLDSVPDASSPAFASRHPVTMAFDKFAAAVTRWAGSPIAFGAAVMSVLAWLVCGPLFAFSENWQLVINTGTTIITFLMVFLIQQSQNKDSVALHLKLNELLASNRAASNQLIGIEDASEDDLRRIAAAYLRLVKEAGQTSLSRTAAGWLRQPGALYCRSAGGILRQGRALSFPTRGLQSCEYHECHRSFVGCLDRPAEDEPANPIRYATGVGVAGTSTPLAKTRAPIGPRPDRRVSDRSIRTGGFEIVRCCRSAKLTAFVA
ncbi:low affinity Fe/Cu permease [Paraburkholderia sp. GAS199]